GLDEISEALEEVDNGSILAENPDEYMGAVMDILNHPLLDEDRIIGTSSKTREDIAELEPETIGRISRLNEGLNSLDLMAETINSNLEQLKLDTYEANHTMLKIADIFAQDFTAHHGLSLTAQLVPKTLKTTDAAALFEKYGFKNLKKLTEPSPKL
ncbi:MAG TPA: hypothetical protein VIF12_00220, partial [Micavibrio sp.]